VLLSKFLFATGYKKSEKKTLSLASEWRLVPPGMVTQLAVSLKKKWTPKIRASLEETLLRTKEELPPKATFLLLEEDSPGNRQK